MKGTEVMASGNLLNWEIKESAGCGGIQAVFTSQPTEADLDEGKLFLQTKIPDKARPIFAEHLEGPGATQSARARLDEFVYRGSSN